jgi:hypothetical protein
MARSGAGLQTDQTAGPSFEEREKLSPPELTAHHGLSVAIDAMDLNNVLGEINADCAKIQHGWLLCSGQ